MPRSFRRLIEIEDKTRGMIETEEVVCTKRNGRGEMRPIEWEKRTRETMTK